MRGVGKGSLVQSILENFVALYPNLSIRGGFMKNWESLENSADGGGSGGVQRGVQRGLVESEIRQPENKRFGGESTS